MTEVQQLIQLTKDTFEIEQGETFTYTIRVDDGEHSYKLEECYNPQDALEAYYKELALGPRPEQGIKVLELCVENDGYCDTFLSEDWMNS